ncbi:MAG TPA: IreB family regulatory phosphoprotein [Candidatus Scatomorpha merdipullorum]|uniref:IreB family regulatory phosphoprotein n=1 Tax=Candidatus Scatomorpha merdipullorum TaxID=2840927 RepID=A0A9D1FDJ5_9FIRM|nr:IreB family regulatory phosphoprotein [Candidatus Scatomorpha merdipullorum]
MFKREKSVIISSTPTKEALTVEDATRRFTAIDERSEIREILSSVYDSLKVKGYNPINQLVGYIVSEDPTYITNYNNARALICRIDRDELLQELLISYLGK